MQHRFPKINGKAIDHCHGNGVGSIDPATPKRRKVVKVCHHGHTLIHNLSNRLMTDLKKGGLLHPDSNPGISTKTVFATDLKR